MPTIELQTKIDAPRELVFDLARSIDLHVDSTAASNERAIAGRTSGLIQLGETVTWEATHFFIRQQLTVKIEQLDRPNHFQDAMVSGAFSRFVHNHTFADEGAGTLMTDSFDFTSPLGILGQFANLLLVTRHMRKLLITRNAMIKTVAENGDPKGFANQSTS